MVKTLTPAAAPPVCPSPPPLDALLQNRDYYGLLAHTLPRIAQASRDAATALYAVQGYVGLGLIGPARELLAEVETAVGPAGEIKQTSESLARLPTGQIAWQHLTSRFERNAARLYEAHPHLRAHDAAFRTAPERLELFRTLIGQFHIRDRSAPRAAWRRPLIDWQAIAAGGQLPHDPKALFCSPYLVLNDYLCALFGRVFAATQSGFMTYAPRIYLIAPDLLDVAVVLYTAETLDALCHERTFLAAGPDCFEQFERHLLSHLERRIPDLCVRMPDTAGDDERRLIDVLRRLATYHAQETSARAANLRTQYDDLPAAYWAERFGDAGAELRIVGMTSRFTTVLQYAMRDLKSAFERLGHRFDIVIEPSDFDLPTAPAISARLLDARPDLMVVIDHLRAEFTHVIPAGLPYVCWIQDLLPHLVTTQAGRGMGPMDFYVVPSRYQFSHTYAYPAAQGMTWTMATNDRLYSAKPVDAATLGKYRCDFSYVSNQSQTPAEFHESLRARFGVTDGAARLMECIYASLMADGARGVGASPRPAMQIIAEAVNQTGYKPSDPQIEDQLARQYVHSLAELIFRQNTLEWTADYCDRTGHTLRVFGRGWEKHPRFARYAGGVAENGEELRAIYQASKVNLQIISTGAIHQRLLDGLAAGGFFLIRSCPIDGLQEPARALLQAVERYDIRANTDYSASEVREFDRALRALAFWRGAPAGETTRISVEELDFFRGLSEDRFRRVAGAVFPQYHDVAYSSLEDFETLADRFLASEEARRDLATAMRQVVLNHFTYDAFAEALVAFLRDRLTHCAVDSI